MVYCKFSKKAYEIKPTVDDMKTIFYDMINSNSANIDFKALGERIEEGHSILLGKYKDNCNSVLEDKIEYLECIALDIDSKENEITLFEMQSLIFKKFGTVPILAYPTFSDTGYIKFRLIYRFENPVDVEVYRSFYEALQWKFKKYLDQATKNANRIWAGTDKKVIYNKNDVPFDFGIMIKLINSHQKSLERNKKKVEIKKKENYETFENEDYIKPEFKQEVMNYIIENTDILAFIERHFGGNYKNKGHILTGSCPLPNHQGDGSNKEAFVIFKNTNTYRCFTHCGSGNIFTLAKQIYNIDNFSQLVFRITDEFNIGIDEDMIWRGKNGSRK